MHNDAFLCTLIIYHFQWVLNYYCNEKTNNDMNVVNTRTNILCIHGCHTRTNHKKMKVVTHALHISWKHSLLKKTSSCKTKVQMPKRSMHGCMRTCNKFSWGGCWASEMSYFIHLSLHYSLHFIIPLTFHYITFINTFGFHLPIFHFIHFCIISEFMINYQKIYMF